MISDVSGLDVNKKNPHALDSMEFMDDYNNSFEEHESQIISEAELPINHYKIERHGSNLSHIDRNIQYGSLFKDAAKVMYCKFSPDGNLLATTNSKGYLKM